MNKFPFVTFLLLLSYSPITAQIINVPGDQPTIQAGIDAAQNGDIVLVAEGTYYENINFKGKAITVASHFYLDSNSTHIDSTIIDGSQPTHPDSGSVVTFNSGEDTTSALYGFTITGGTGTFIPGGPPPGPPNMRIGGGIFIAANMGARITNNIIEQNVISTNDFAGGGGIYSEDPGGNGYSIIVDNIIRNNTASGEITFTMGGGICMGGSGKIVKNIITENICYSTNADVVGGGVRLWLLTGSPDTAFCLIEDNIISANKSVSVNGSAHAGGLNSSNTVITLKGNTFANNIVETNVESWGAAMHLGGLSAESRIENNLFSGNHHLGSGICYGGALHIYYSHPVVANNIFDNNEANFGGAIYMVNGSQPVFINNTINGNNALNTGGGIYSYQSTLNVINSILWGNSAPSGEQIYRSGGADYIRYSDVQGSWLGEGNIDADPLFSDTLLHLSDSSPCIGAGIDSIEITGIWNYAPPYDFDGDPRPNPSGSKPDMGVYESPLEFPVSVENNLLQIPDEYSLAQNYPNPFNPSTTIKYQLPIRGHVTLRVYNLLGQEIATLVNGVEEPGYKSVQWDGTGVASGVYFYRLRAGDPSAGSGQSFVDTKKLLHLK